MTNETKQGSKFLSDMKDWPAFNAVYREFFKPPFPARSATGPVAWRWAPGSRCSARPVRLGETAMGKGNLLAGWPGVSRLATSVPASVHH